MRRREGCVYIEDTSTNKMTTCPARHPSKGTVNLASQFYFKLSTLLVDAFPHVSACRSLGLLRDSGSGFHRECRVRRCRIRGVGGTVARCITRITSPDSQRQATPDLEATTAVTTSPGAAFWSTPGFATAPRVSPLPSRRRVQQLQEGVTGQKLFFTIRW